jgi:YD repeat-containing protein
MLGRRDPLRAIIRRLYSSTGWARYTHDARGALLSRRLPNDTVTYHAYDAAGRVASIADRKSDGSAICSFAFSRDANGNILTSQREDGSCWYCQHLRLQRPRPAGAHRRIGGANGRGTFREAFPRRGKKLRAASYERRPNEFRAATNGEEGLFAPSPLGRGPG